MKVKKVTVEEYIGKVYNLHCKTNHNYFANGILAHNCYKQNISSGINMKFDDFKKIFNKLPKTLSQIAFGIGDVKANPDLYNIMDYCIENEVVPNITVNGNIDDEDANNLSKRCGAVAVSHYGDNLCFNAIDKLYKHGVKYINIHKIIAEETFEDCMRLLKYINESDDERIRGLYAVVFLTLKPKGSRNTWHPINDINKYKELLKYAIQNNIKIGFDSCSAPSFISTMGLLLEENFISEKIHDSLTGMSDPCESTLFSIYINAEGKVFPCSFMEGCEEYSGIDLLDKNINFENFVKKIWDNKENELSEFRDKLLCSGDCNGRRCPKYNIYPENI